MKSQSAKRTFSLALLAAVPASLAVAGALVYRRYRRDIRAARARISSGSKLANTPSGLIEYADVGTGSPVFVIHGAGGGFDQGLEFAQPLIDAGFRIIAPSRFGYLRTPLPKDASPMAQADAHASLLDVLRLEKVAVVGISAGAVQLGRQAIVAATGSAASELLDVFNLVDAVVDVHDERNEWRSLSSTIHLLEGAAIGLGIPTGGGVAVHPDGEIEPLRQPAHEFLFDGSRLTHSLLCPREDD